MKSMILHRLDIMEKNEFLNSGLVSSVISNELLNYWEEKLNLLSGSPNHSYFDYFLFFLSMRENILAVVIYDHKNKGIAFKYGISDIFEETNSDISSTVSGSSEIKIYKDQEVQIRIVFFQRFDKLRNYTVSIAAPAKLDIQTYWIKLRHVFIAYYIFEPTQEKAEILNLFKIINQDIITSINSLTEQGKTSCFTYLKFEPLKSYIKLAGEYFVSNLEKFLCRSIEEKMMGDDKLYILSPQDYLLVSLNSTDEVMKEKFYRSSFQMKGLLITYQIKFYIIQEKIEDLAHVWNDICIE